MSLSLLRPLLLNDLPGIRAGFTTRPGGVSSGPYSALNMGLFSGDQEALVLENRRRAASALGFESNDLAIPGQVHGSGVKTVESGGLFPGFDGVVTAMPGILLGISAADCAAVLLADPVAGIVAACHAGWRGCVAGIPERTVASMASLGARPDRTRAWISPCISAQHFEVGEEVAAQFKAEFVIRRPEWPRPHVDLPAAVASRLLAAGLGPEQIEASQRCTVGESSLFFSHRASGGTTGRMMGLIGLAT